MFVVLLKTLRNITTYIDLVALLSAARVHAKDMSKAELPPTKESRQAALLPMTLSLHDPSIKDSCCTRRGTAFGSGLYLAQIKSEPEGGEKRSTKIWRDVSLP